MGVDVDVDDDIQLVDERAMDDVHVRVGAEAYDVSAMGTVGRCYTAVDEDSVTLLLRLPLCITDGDSAPCYDVIVFMSW